MPCIMAHKIEWFLDHDRITAITVPKPTPPLKTFEPTKESPDWASNPVEDKITSNKIRLATRTNESLMFFK